MEKIYTHSLILSIYAYIHTYMYVYVIYIGLEVGIKKKKRKAIGVMSLRLNCSDISSTVSKILKLLSAIFYQIFIFYQMKNYSKTLQKL